MRARLAVVAPDLAKGVRAALATLVPFYLAGAYGRPELAWIYLAATVEAARAHLASGRRALPRERPRAETPALQHLLRRGELIAGYDR